MSRKYKDIYENSINNKEDFWKNISNDIFWYKKPTKILNSDNPPFYKWYEDGVTNTCYNAVDLHVKNGNGEKLAIIYDSPITNSKKNITYAELKDQVSIFAGALANQGIKKGDRVIIYMPMIPEAVVAMLAKAKLSDEKIIAGECAVPGIIALIGLFKNKDYLDKLDINPDSKVLLFGCEGLTDKTMYKKLLDDGLKKI